MKQLFLISIFLVLFPIMGNAATLEWDRNIEADMKDYQVYGCFVLNCVVVKNSSNLIGTVNQPAIGIKPSLAYTLGPRAGSIAVSARDLSLNESGLSAPIMFNQLPVVDILPPSPPQHIVIK